MRNQRPNPTKDIDRELIDPEAWESEAECRPGNPNVRLSLTVSFPDRYLDLLDRAADAANTDPAQLIEQYVMERLERDAANRDAKGLVASA